MACSHPLGAPRYRGRQGGDAVIEEAASPKRGLAGIVEAVQELHKTIPPDAWDVLPADGAKNYKHYLYGSPKEED